MDFIPEQPKEEKEVPYFEETTSVGGWAGHTTKKTEKRLKSEITEAITLLGGMVSGFQSGTYSGKSKRDGFRIYYSLENPNGGFTKGQLDVAALPIETPAWDRSYKKRREQSLKMALYMLRDALKGMWYMQQLSPGFAALMPFMIVDDSGKNLTQKWSEQGAFSNLLPPGDSEFEVIDGDFEEAK